MQSLESREQYAKLKVAYMKGEIDRHPGGYAAQKREVVPTECGKGCWDTAPRGWRFSEWGNAAGMV